MNVSCEMFDLQLLFHRFVIIALSYWHFLILTCGKAQVSDFTCTEAGITTTNTFNQMKHQQWGSVLAFTITFSWQIKWELNKMIITDRKYSAVLICTKWKISCLLLATCSLFCQSRSHLCQRQWLLVLKGKIKGKLAKCHYCVYFQ